MVEGSANLGESSTPLAVVTLPAIYAQSKVGAFTAVFSSWSEKEAVRRLYCLLITHPVIYAKRLDLEMYSTMSNCG
jgi:hypothetical protein